MNTSDQREQSLPFNPARPATTEEEFEYQRAQTMQQYIRHYLQSQAKSYNYAITLSDRQVDLIAYLLSLSALRLHEPETFQNLLRSDKDVFQSAQPARVDQAGRYPDGDLPMVQ